MSRRHSATCVFVLLTVVLLATVQAFAVVPTGPSISVSASSNPAAAGSVLTLNAALTGGTGFYTGRVRFTVDGNLLGYGSVNSGHAIFKTNQLVPGTRTISAAYFGDASNVINTPGTLLVAVKGVTTSTISSNVNPSLVGSTVTFTGTATTYAASWPSGTVSFKDVTGSPFEIGTGTLGSSSASLGLSLNTLSSGTMYGNGDHIGYGDVDGDGIIDMVWSTGSYVYTAHGNGDGTFGNVQANATSGCTVISFALVDTSRRGVLDLIGACGGYGIARIYQGNGDGTFQGGYSATLNVGSITPGYIATGDFDGDGITDLAMSEASSVTVFLGDGAGNFSISEDVSTTAPGDLVLADLDGDGHLDIVPQSNSYPGVLDVLYGNGDGTFTAVSYGIANGWFGANSVAVGDFDNDGHLDIALSSAQGVDIYKGDGARNFAQTQYSGPRFQHIAVMDINGDGYPDVVGTYHDFSGPTAYFRVMYGTSSGTFGNSTTDTTLNVLQYNRMNMVLADLDGGGRPDVIIEGVQDTNYQAAFYTGLSHASAWATFGTNSLAVGSYDIVANYEGDSLFNPSTSAQMVQVVEQVPFVALLNTPPSATYGDLVQLQAQVSGGFGTPTGTVYFYDGSTLLGSCVLDASGFAGIGTYSIGGGTRNITAHYSGDSVYGPLTSDPAVINVARATPTVSVSDDGVTAVPGVVTLTATLSVPGGAPTGYIAFYSDNAYLGSALYVNGAITSSATLKTASISTGFHLIFAKYAGDSNFTPASGYEPIGMSPVAATYTSVQSSANPSSLGDNVTFTGTAVTYVPGANLTGTLTFSNNGSSFASVPIGNLTSGYQDRYDVPFSGTGVAAGDFNNDGHPDFVYSTSSSLYLSINDGTGSFVSGFLANTSCPIGLVAADLNNDGNMDVAWIDTCGVAASNNNLVILIGNGDGTFQSPKYYATGSSQGQTLKLADLNGDGFLDAIAADYTDGIAVFMNNGDGTFGGHATFNAGKAYRIAAGDLNGDGITDLAISNFVDSSLTVVIGNGDGTFQAPTTPVYGIYPIEELVLYDFDGDGKLDLVFSQGSTLWVYKGNGNGTFAAQYSQTTNSQLQNLQVVDVDGDGNVDLLSGGYSSHNVDFLLGDGHLDFFEESFPVPIYDQFIAAADFAGGGKMGFVIASPFETGQVYEWQQSGTAQGSTTGLATGTAPITASYSSDGNYLGSTSPTLNQVVYDSVARVTSPLNGATNVDASSGVEVDWSTVLNVQSYYLYVGTTVGGTNVYLSGSTTNTSAQVNNLNANTTYYLRLFTKRNNGWKYVDSTFTTGNLGKSSVVTSPANGATNVDASSLVTISWVGGQNVATNYLYVGTTVGSANVYGSGEVTVTSKQVKLQPSTTYYCRLFTKNTSNSWSYTDSTFTTGTQGTAAAIISPSNGATNVDGSAPISVTWNSAPGAITYFLYVGTTVGANDVYASGETTNTSASLTRFINPSTTYYVRLFTKFGIGWKYRDTTFTTGAQQLMAFVTSPTNGATGIAHPSVTISWSSATSPQAYFLYVGTTPGAKDVFAYGETLNTSVGVSGLSASTTYYLRMWTRNSAGVWHYNDSTFTTGP